MRGRGESQAFRLSRSGGRRKRILGVVTNPAERLGFRRSSQTTSYDKLLERAASLDFRIRLPDEPFFCEGEVSEVDVLVDVDEGFVMRCEALIEEVSALIRSKEDV